MNKTSDFKGLITALLLAILTIVTLNIILSATTYSYIQAQYELLRMQKATISVPNTTLQVTYRVACVKDQTPTITVFTYKPQNHEEYYLLSREIDLDPAGIDAWLLTCVNQMQNAVDNNVTLTLDTLITSEEFIQNHDAELHSTDDSYTFSFTIT